jgi:SpoVK/Ycf46/Vps4 family AAA+-type ATPase
MDAKYNAQPRIEHTRNEVLAVCEQLQAGPAPACRPDEAAPASLGEAPADAPDRSEDGGLWQTSGATGVRFGDITGAAEALQTIWEALIVPVKFPVIFRQAKVKPWRAVLLYGPPGTGKSMIARATASESAANFYNACCAELTSKWVGGSEKLMKSLFAHAREHSPAIIFFDEIDSVAGARDGQKSIADQRLTNQLLIELDACQHASETLFVIAATNLPWQIDVAVMRRFPKRIYVALPDSAGRAAMFTNALAGVAALSADELALVVAATHGFSGADICHLVNDVGLEPLRLLTSATAFLVRVCAASGDAESVEAISDLAAAAAQASPAPAPADADAVAEPETAADARGAATGAGTHYVLEHTSLEAIVARFSEQRVRVGGVSFAMLLACVQRCKGSVDAASIRKYEAYNAAG